MTEIDYLKCKLEDTEKAFDKLHKRYIELLKQQGKLEIENKQLKEYCTMLKSQIKKMGELGGFNKHMIKTILESNYDD